MPIDWSIHKFACRLSSCKNQAERFLLAKLVLAPPPNSYLPAGLGNNTRQIVCKKSCKCTSKVKKSSVYSDSVWFIQILSYDAIWLISNSSSRCCGSSITLKLCSVLYCDTDIASTLLAVMDWSFGKQAAWSFQKCIGVMSSHVKWHATVCVQFVIVQGNITVSLNFRHLYFFIFWIWFFQYRFWLLSLMPSGTVTVSVISDNTP